VNESGVFSAEISLYVLMGIVSFFFIEKFIHWRHCHIPTSDRHPHPFAYMNLFGDGVHNFIDGLIIGASYIVSIPLGIATTLAVLFHEIPQEIGDFGVLLHGGFSKNRALFMNFLTALTAVAGAAAALVASMYMEGLTLFLVPFAAGNFLYIATSDLIPELKKECGMRKSAGQLIFILLGIGVMYWILLVNG
jgi:zinc and cadmium transporter